VILYNEWDAYPAQWLENLVGRGELDEGFVDSRSVGMLRVCPLRARESAAP